MADPAGASARAHETPRPDVDAIADKLALVTQGTEWSAESVMAAKRDLLALCAEVRRLRSLAGIAE